METENPQKRKWIIIFIFIIIIVVVFLIWIMGGFRTIVKSVVYLVYFAVFIAFVSLIAYIIYYIKFKEHKIDITWLNKQKLIQSAKACKNDYLHDLYLTGDRSHASVKLGKIKGYTQIMCYKGKKVHYDDFMLLEEKDKKIFLEKHAKGIVKKDDEGFMMYEETYKPHPDMNISKKRWVNFEIPEKEDIFLINKGGFLADWFSEYMVLRVSPDDHSDLIGDVSIKAVALIKLSEYFYINKDYLDTRKIDYTILQEAKRGIMFLAFADMHDIVQTAMNLDSRYKKQMDQQGLLKEPTKQVVHQPST